MMELGFKSVKSEPCVYTYTERGALYILTMYIEDVIFLGSDLLVLRRINLKRMSRFSRTDIRDVSLMLGMGVTRDREKETIAITQDKHTYIYCICSW